MINDKARRGARNVLLLQLIVAVCLAGFWLLGKGGLAAQSALLGGGVHILPSWVFAQKMFRYAGAQQAQQIVKSFYLGEALKLLLTLLLFALVFIYIKIDPLAFFITFVVIQAVFWLAPVLMKTRD